MARARAIVGIMATSLQTLRSMAFTGHLKVPPPSAGLWTQKARELRTLDIFLRAAAEIGHVDAVRHLLELREAEPYRPQAAQVKSDMSSYLRDREIGLETMGMGLGTMKTIGIPFPVEDTPFPIPVYLAAVRQHEEVLAVLLPRQHSFIQDLLERAQDVHLGCKGFVGFRNTTL